MVTATFRFYGELNDFLAPARRQQAFDSPCAQAATTKHMIEALGVPHTEVDLVVVNGTPALFDRLLCDGDRVAIYPRFAAIDIDSLARLRQPHPPARRFVADAHLGGLARLLRMAASIRCTTIISAMRRSRRSPPARRASCSRATASCSSAAASSTAATSMRCGRLYNWWKWSNGSA